MDDRNEILLDIARSFGATIEDDVVIDDRNEILLEIAKALGATIEEGVVIDDRNEILRLIAGAAEGHAGEKTRMKMTILLQDFNNLQEGQYVMCECGNMSAPAFDEDLRPLTAEEVTNRRITYDLGEVSIGGATGWFEDWEPSFSSIIPNAGEVGVFNNPGDDEPVFYEEGRINVSTDTPGEIHLTFIGGVA